MSRFLLVTAIQHDLWGEFSRLCFPLSFLSFALTLLVRGVPIVWKLLLHDSLHRTDPHPQILCLPFFVFIFCPISFLGDWFAFPDIWGPPPAFRICSVGVAPHAHDIFGREKVVSPSCSSAIWGLSPSPLVVLKCVI